MFFSSCNNWLDVKPQGQTEEEDMYTTYEGFKNALIGCYTLMRDNYSPDASMVVGGVEYMANLWITATDGGTAYDFASHDYRADLVEMNLSQLFLKQYEIIANVNTLLEYIDIQNNVLTEDEEDLYKGEALGLRAFIHFDLGLKAWISEMILEKINRRQKCPECLRNMLCLYTSILSPSIQGIFGLLTLFVLLSLFH